MHIYWLGRAKERFEKHYKNIGGRLLLFAEIFSSHLMAAIIFAVALWLGARLGLGTFKDAPLDDPLTYFYFSLINITTVGLGDIMPTNHLKFVAGAEALTGFLLISCSAQLVWKSMHE